MFKSGDKVKCKFQYIVTIAKNTAFDGSTVTVKQLHGTWFLINEYSGYYDSTEFELADHEQKDIDFETKVLQAIAKGVLNNDQRMLAELVIKRDILQKEIERLNQQIYAKQSDVNRLTKFIA